MTATTTTTTTTERWLVERLVPGGEGFLRLPDGRAAFVPGGLPGDEVVVEQLEDRGSFVRAQRFQIASPGPDRRRVPCPVADRCGGCDWMALEPDAQQRHKVDVVVEALRRTGKVTPAQRPSLVSGGSDVGYRNRVRFHVDGAGRVGFRGRGGQDLIEVEHCLVAAPAVAPRHTELRALAAASPGDLMPFDGVELRVDDDGVAVARLFPRRSRSASGNRGPGRRPASPSKAARTAARNLAAAWPGVEVFIDGQGVAPLQHFRSGGDVLEVPADAFVQVNGAVNERLVAAVVAGAQARGARRFVDLYCGAGNFSLPLLAAGLVGAGIDGTGSAIEAARNAARERGLPGEFRAGPVGRELGRLTAGETPPDLVVVDPPRAGMGRAVDPIIALGARALAICGCDPVPLARDLRRLLDAGYQVDEVTVFDMFPQTHHAEVLVWLARSSPDARD